MSLKFFSTPNDLLSKSKNLVLENSVFALGGSILLAQWRQRLRVQQYSSIKNRIDEEQSLILGNKLKANGR